MTTLAFDHPGAAPLLSPPDPGVLERNLAALSRTSPRTADRVRSSAPRADLRFLQTDDRVPSVEVIDALGLAPARALASRRRPLREGWQLAEAIDVASTAAVGVMGFGAGYHVRALAERMRRTGVIAVFEPDVALLRAVLERIDHAGWLQASNTVVFTDPDDAAAISAALSGVEGIVMMGLALLEHAPSLERLGEARTRFYRNLQDVIAAIRTTVATTMVQARTTVANAVRNLGWYVSKPGIADLAGTRRGTPAIVVSAGPSLQRNIDELARPGVRERFTIIAAQTVLRTLLARGVRPHYVVALDHSEISARFYEGLTAADVAGVTLVLEPKVSPAVPSVFPGEIRLARDPFLDTLLGPELKRDMGAITAGATVAHLAYYLARHLGADPVVLVGQDLGFTDGQYYAAGASIHDVWACELNQFNSLERMEWERIKRMGSHLRRATDHAARPIYTDDQLATYLVQFERDFLGDTHRGLSVIDATEGGVAKRHTRAEPLREVIDRELSRSPAAGAGRPATPSAPGRTSHRRAEDQVRRVQRDVHRIADLSRKTAALLAEMLASHSDQRRVSALIDEVHALRDKVESLSPAIDLVHFLNQAGAFARIRADRSIHLDASLAPLERQKREIERDIANVGQIARTAEELAEELGVGAAVLAGAERVGSKPVVRTGSRRDHPGVGAGAGARAHAIIAAPAGRTADVPGLGDPLHATLRRLVRATRLESVVVLSDEPEAVASAIRDMPARVPIRVHRAERLREPGHAAIRAARAPAADCWRAGIAGACVYDEVLAAEATLRAMEDLAIEGALIVGPDWCFVDPGLCDAVIERGCRIASTHRLAFSQAPPGVAGVFANRALLADLVKLRRGSSPFATLGGLISYMPSAPALDPLGRENCAPIDPSLRDLGLRLIPDSPARAEFIARAIEKLGPERAAAAPTADCVPLLRQLAADAPMPPSCLTIEAPDSASPLNDAMERAVTDFARVAPGGLLTIRDADPCLEGVRRVAEAVRGTGVVMHLRTSLACQCDPADLLGTAPDIVSIDLPDPGDGAEWNRVHRAVEGLVTAARARQCHTWIVPRVTKSDATVAHLEGFFDRWLLTTGAAAVDPLPAAQPGERIEALPLPASARRRFARTAMYIRADATVHAGDYFDRSTCATPAADMAQHTLEEAWRRLLVARAGETG